MSLPLKNMEMRHTIAIESTLKIKEAEVSIGIKNCIQDFGEIGRKTLNPDDSRDLARSVMVKQ